MKRERERGRNEAVAGAASSFSCYAIYLREFRCRPRAALGCCCGGWDPGAPLHVGPPGRGGGHRCINLGGGPPSGARAAARDAGPVAMAAAAFSESAPTSKALLQEERVPPRPGSSWAARRFAALSRSRNIPTWLYCLYLPCYLLVSCRLFVRE